MTLIDVPGDPLMGTPLPGMDTWTAADPGMAAVAAAAKAAAAKEAAAAASQGGLSGKFGAADAALLEEIARKYGVKPTTRLTR
jgi:hypothetical protein